MSLINNGTLVTFKEKQDDEKELLVIVNNWSDVLQKYTVVDCNSNNTFMAASDQLDNTELSLNKLLKIGIEQISRYGTFIPEEVQLTDRNIIAIFKTSALVRIADALESINDSLDSINQLIIKNQKSQ